MNLRIFSSVDIQTVDNVIRNLSFLDIKKPVFQNGKSGLNLKAPNLSAHPPIRWSRDFSLPDAINPLGTHSILCDSPSEHLTHLRATDRLNVNGLHLFGATG